MCNPSARVRRTKIKEIEIISVMYKYRTQMHTNTLMVLILNLKEDLDNNYFLTCSEQSLYTATILADKLRALTNPMEYKLISLINA